ncbi:MAG: hypothetical protein CSA34_07260 [Desulfobulbus propionicus]|nr:MAG: hypothetical protein CSA34_07260 [Desulfobulbus propionicus]
MTANRLVNVGFGNVVMVSRILAVVNPGSSPVRKLKEEARKEQRLIDVTEGRRTRGIILLDTGHLVLTSVQPETINQRLAALDSEHRSLEPFLQRIKERDSDA